MKYEILDKGFIDVMEIFGDELTIVNAARVSFGKRKDVFDDSDEKLIKYLIQHKHYSPFRHVFLRFHIKAPEFVMRQSYKHCVGIEVTSCHPNQLHGFNEISGRYIVSDEYYIPTEWRKQSTNSKQGSNGSVDNVDACTKTFTDTMDIIMKNYHQLVEEYGVAKEQARIILPLNIYTETIWTMSLQALFNFVTLRMDEHAQYEIREYARIMDTILLEKFPIVYKYWSQV